jgi:hypothetical protein
MAIRLLPGSPLIERSACCQLLNFDFELSVSAPDTLTITRIDVSVLDAGGRLVSRRHVSGNGMIPSIATVPNVRVTPGPFDFGYGAPVVAPGAGVVRDAENSAKEHQLPGDQWDDEAGLRNPRSIAGNFVVIDHENGEVSFLAHLQQGSLLVKACDRVQRGQVIGKMGLSGDSDETPHIHYQLMSAAGFQDADRLPAHFSGFVRRGAARPRVERRGQIDTGDVIDVPAPGRGPR